MSSGDNAPMAPVDDARAFEGDGAPSTPDDAGDTIIPDEYDPLILRDNTASIAGAAALASPGEDAAVAPCGDAPATLDDAPVALGDDALRGVRVLAVADDDAPVTQVVNASPITV